MSKTVAKKMPLARFLGGSCCGTEYGAVRRMRAKVPFRVGEVGREERPKSFKKKKKILKGLNFFHKQWVKRGEGREMIDFWPDHTRSTVGKT